MRAKFVFEAMEESDFSPSQKKSIKKFVLTYKGDFKDEDVHNFAKSIGLDKHEVEEYIYSLARKGLKNVNEENTIKGGKGDKLTTKDVCPKQLAIGRKVEREHTNSAEKATEIALDHLSENPKYYTELVEKGMVDEGPAIAVYKKYFGEKKLPKKKDE
jgi:hypothetical protein